MINIHVDCYTLVVQLYRLRNLVILLSHRQVNMIIHWILEHSLNMTSSAFGISICCVIRTIRILVFNNSRFVKVKGNCELLRIEACKIFLHFIHLRLIELDSDLRCRIVTVIIVVNFATLFDIMNGHFGIVHRVKSVVSLHCTIELQKTYLDLFVINLPLSLHVAESENLYLLHKLLSIDRILSYFFLYVCVQPEIVESLSNILCRIKSNILANINHIGKLSGNIL